MLSKMKTSVVVAALLLAVSAHAKDTSVAAPVKINVEAIQASLSDLPAVEIPVKASKMMQAASKEAKLGTAKAILESVLELRPQMAIQLVASLVKASPETASQVATLGATIVPQYATQIIKVAAATAPAFAKDIALASSAVFPNQQENIVALVSAVVPSARAEIAASVDRQANMLRIISEALGQGSSDGGTTTTFNKPISEITRENTTLLNQLASAIALQLGGGRSVTVNVDNNTGVISINVSFSNGDPDGDNSLVLNPATYPATSSVQVGIGGPGFDPDRIVYNAD